MDRLSFLHFSISWVCYMTFVPGATKQRKIPYILFLYRFTVRWHSWCHGQKDDLHLWIKKGVFLSQSVCYFHFNLSLSLSFSFFLSLFLSLSRFFSPLLLLISPVLDNLKGRLFREKKKTSRIIIELLSWTKPTSVDVS